MLFSSLLSPSSSQSLPLISACTCGEHTKNTTYGSACVHTFGACTPRPHSVGAQDQERVSRLSQELSKLLVEEDKDRDARSRSSHDSRSGSLRSTPFITPEGSRPHTLPCFLSICLSFFPLLPPPAQRCPVCHAGVEAATRRNGRVTGKQAKYFVFLTKTLPCPQAPSTRPTRPSIPISLATAPRR